MLFLDFKQCASYKFFSAVGWKKEKKIDKLSTANHYNDI